MSRKGFLAFFPTLALLACVRQPNPVGLYDKRGCCAVPPAVERAPGQKVNVLAAVQSDALARLPQLPVAGAVAPYLCRDRETVHDAVGNPLFGLFQGVAGGIEAPFRDDQRPVPLHIGVRGLALHGVFALFLFRPGPLREDRHFGITALTALIDLKVDHVVALAVQPHDQGRDGRRGIVRGGDLEGPVRGKPRPQAAYFGGLLDDLPRRHARLDRHFDESRITPGNVELGDAKGPGNGGDGFR